MEWSDSRSDRIIPGKEHTVRMELEYIYIYNVKPLLFSCLLLLNKYSEDDRNDLIM